MVLLKVLVIFLLTVFMTIAYKFWHQVDGVVLNDYECYSCDWDINITFHMFKRVVTNNSIRF